MARRRLARDVVVFSEEPPVNDWCAHANKKKHCTTTKWDRAGWYAPSYCTLLQMPDHARRRSASDRLVVPSFAASMLRAIL